jgi:hypothetical protein
MKQSTPVRLTRALSWAIGIILALVPFHAFLTVWLSSIFGHYTVLRLWKEFILSLVTAGALYLIATDKPLRQRLLSWGLARLIGLYAALMLLTALIPLITHNVTGKAMWYGLLVDLRFLVFFLVAWAVAAKDPWLKSNWKKILLLPAVMVSAFAILQYLVLPRDFLKHFGYGNATIAPYETINHNLAHLRVASTLRGANPLGAYMVMPIAALGVMLAKERKQRAYMPLLSLGIIIAMIFSFSRSAWIGAIAALAVIAWLAIKNLRFKKIILMISACALLAALALGLALRNSTGFQSVVYHTDIASNVKTSSDAGHSAAFKSAIKDIARQPLGRGVGTAGPQSTYNYGHAGRIAENYFLQIGQEAGWLGMLLFIAICFSVGRELWLRRTDSLALWLLASLIGLTFINLLSHAWTDDTLAYLWWGLAGIACAPAILSDRHKQKNAKKIKAA